MIKAHYISTELARFVPEITCKASLFQNFPSIVCMSTLPTGKEGMASPNLRRRPPQRAADVTLVIGGDTVDANREALAAQSDFFRGMFSANFSEREKKEVELFDVPAPIEVVRRVVEFAELYPRCQLDIDDVDGLCGALAVADMMGIR